MSKKSDPNKLINNLSKVITDCSSLSADYQRKHGELLEIAGSFEKAVDIIKIQMTEHKQLIHSLFEIINSANILSREDLDKMRDVQDTTMNNFKQLQQTLDIYNDDNSIAKDYHEIMNNNLNTNNNLKTNNNLNTNNNEPDYNINNNNYIDEVDSVKSNTNNNNLNPHNALSNSINKLHNAFGESQKNENINNLDENLKNKLMKGGSRKKTKKNKKKYK